MNRSSVVPARFYWLVAATLVSSPYTFAQEEVGSFVYGRLFVVPAIIFGLALAKIARELSRIIRAPKHVPRSCPQVIWIGVMLLFIMVMFFSSATLEVPLQDFRIFIATNFLALLIFLACDFLVSPAEDRPELARFQEDYHSNARHFVTMCLLALICHSARDSYLYWDDPERAKFLTKSNLERLGVGLVLLPALIWVHRTVHIVAASITLAILLYHVSMFYISA